MPGGVHSETGTPDRIGCGDARVDAQRDVGVSKVLVVSGEAVEERGGVFEYHDGRLHGGARELESRFRRADVVLCPVNCNSHGACLLLKNLGKKHGKPVHMLPGFGLGTVSRAMAAGAN